MACKPPRRWGMKMTIQNSSARDNLISRFGVFADPSLHVELEAALERVVRLPAPYRLREGLPQVLTEVSRGKLLQAWGETSFLLATAIQDAWDRAGHADAGRGSKMAWDTAVGSVQVYAKLLRHADLGYRLRSFRPAAFDLIGVWGKDWIELVRVAMTEGTELHDLVVALPQWDKANHKRRTDAKWIARLLKRLRERVEAHLAWIFGVVGNDRKWASDYAVGMMEADVIWSREWASEHFMARVDDGYCMTMQDLMDSSVALRRSEDYALAIGLQSLAEKHDLKFVLVTVTLPGEYSPKVGNRKSVYNGGSPQEANKVLKAMMKRIRTNLLDGAGMCIGFCVTEPQITGTPHCHVMILTDDPARVESIVLGYKQSADHQIDVRHWHLSPDEGRAASIATYLTKYLMKGKDLDRGTDEALALAAWRRGAACRTTSWFGLGKGFKGRWRVVFRAEMTGEADKIRAPSFKAVRDAMRAKNWGLALSYVADLSAGGIASPVTMVAWEPIRETTMNRYDEPVEAVVGFTLETGEQVLFAIGEWELCETIYEDDVLFPDDVPEMPPGSLEDALQDPVLDSLITASGY